jgi:cytoskeleton protein RodZ
MKTVGEILKEARVKKRIELEDISHRTKISLKYLAAIEKNDFKELPPSTFTKGFMQNYAKVVGLDPKNVLAIFRRDYDQDEKGRIIPRGLTEPVRQQGYYFNPTTTTLGLSILAGVIIIGFFIRQVIVFNTAPEIMLKHPSENAEITSPVEVSGSTAPEATLTINNQPISINETGEFTASLNLTPGEHTLIVTVTSRNHKERTLQRAITIVSQ